jgi:hypothetical protein
MRLKSGGSDTEHVSLLRRDDSVKGVLGMELGLRLVCYLMVDIYVERIAATLPCQLVPFL